MGEMSAPHSAESVGHPEPLSRSHDVSDFHCGEAKLDEWLKHRAMANEESGASRTYVICSGSRVVGYYALAAGAVAHTLAPGSVRRNMPDPVPVMVMGRLALDSRFQGRGIGLDLLMDAVLRSVQAAQIAGIRAMMVHAMSDRAKRFYEKAGFIESPEHPMLLFLPMKQATSLVTAGI